MNDEFGDDAFESLIFHVESEVVFFLDLQTNGQFSSSAHYDNHLSMIHDIVADHLATYMFDYPDDYYRHLPTADAAAKDILNLPIIEFFIFINKT